MVFPVRIPQERTRYVDQDELKVLQEVAHDLLALDDRQLIDALSAGEIIEVCDGND